MIREQGATHLARNIFEALINVDVIEQVRLIYALGRVGHSLYIRRFPTALVKNLSPYLAGSFGTEARTRILLHHYQTMKRVAKSGFMMQLLKAPVSLWQLSEPGFIATMALAIPNHFVREGELSLVLSTNGEKLAELSFTLVRGCEVNMPYETVLMIGQVQGGANLREAIRLCTGMCHGISPTNLLMSGIQAIAPILDAQSIVGVSDEEQLMRAMGNITNLHFSYDRFWSGYGGLLNASGFYEVPIPFARRSLQEFPARKRSQVKRRRHFKDAVAEAVAANLSALCAASYEGTPDLRTAGRRAPA
jgi:uncharacterized protein VirK/YbjX